MEAAKPPLPDAVPISNDNRETGFWLWRGETPAPRPAPPIPSSSRIARVATVIISAARSARWMGPPSGLALIALAAGVALHLLPGGQSLPGNMSAAAPLPVAAPSLARPVSPAAPVSLTEVRPDQAQAPAAPTAQAMGGPLRHNTVRRKARRRPSLTARRSRALFAHRRAPVFVEPCRYQCDGWAEAAAWHGGGY